MTGPSGRLMAPNSPRCFLALPTEKKRERFLSRFLLLFIFPLSPTGNGAPGIRKVPPQGSSRGTFHEIKTAPDDPSRSLGINFFFSNLKKKHHRSERPSEESEETDGALVERLETKDEREGAAEGGRMKKKLIENRSKLGRKPNEKGKNGERERERGNHDFYFVFFSRFLSSSLFLSFGFFFFVCVCVCRCSLLLFLPFSLSGFFFFVVVVRCVPDRRWLKGWADIATAQDDEVDGDRPPARIFIAFS